MSGRIPGRPPIPIPKDMLDPRALPGYQPSPFDVRYHNNPGKTFELGNPGRDATRAESEYISEWCVKLLAPPETLLSVAAGEGFGFKTQLSVRHFGEQFLEYQPSVQANAQPLEIPVYGVCIGVHGRVIDCVILREFVGGAGSLLKLQVAIVPGRPSLSYINRPLTVQGGLGAFPQVAIPTFATRFCIFGQVDAGDIITMRSVSGAGSLQTIPVGAVGQYLPIYPSAGFIAYSSAVNKEMTVGFEILS